MFAEIIFESGTRSVGEYASEQEVLSAAATQHSRASGEAGGPTGHMAERVVAIHLYDVHPSDLPDPSAEVLEAELAGINAAEGAMEAAAKIRDLTSPMVDEPEAGESMYKMEATKVLTEGWEEE